MAKIIEINNVASFVILSGGGSLLRAFNKINTICKIVVPDNLYDQWIAATNWSTYADYIYKASEVSE